MSYYYYYHAEQWSLADGVQQYTSIMVIDLGMIALALLSYDRCQAANNPVTYMARIAGNKARSWRRIGAACLLATAANGIICIGDILLAMYWPTWVPQGYLNMLGNTTRAAYLLASLFT